MSSRRIFLAIGLAAALSGCTTLQTQTLQPEGLRAYKRVYVEQPQEDEFLVVPALTHELNDMGFEVVGKPFNDPLDSDLVAKVNGVGGWDMTRYLQSLQLQFLAAKSGRVVTTSSFYSKGLWQGVRDARLKAVFNDLRAKNGYPPSKQFGQ
ncbi:lipoprotein [Hydrogenophaga sp. 2FB]|uniref:lipoprotein n=1 Tax=Hydrogenophaga sp. 2FB TaxID=2502187 RepID=UPI0010F49B40|nr:lipoprotein [Hydrogenophaga sp. 2FB]